MAGKTFLKIEIKAPVSSADLIEQAKLVTSVEEPLESLKALLPEGTTVSTSLSSERGPLTAPRRRRAAASPAVISAAAE